MSPAEAPRSRCQSGDIGVNDYDTMTYEYIPIDLSNSLDTTERDACDATHEDEVLDAPTTDAYANAD
jgi:hypothetical protein